MIRKSLGLRARKTNQTQFGNYVEEQTCRWLSARDVTILKRNFRCRAGEIDIIGRHQGSIAFIEVRFRRSNQYGGAAASVDARKQQKLIRAAQFYISSRCAAHNAACRFDVVAVTDNNGELDFDWHQAAFSLDDMTHAF